MTRNATTARSRKRGEISELTIDWLTENAPDTCPLLGIQLRYDRNSMGVDSAAVDRIDNDIGYTQANSWVISTKANRIKTNATCEELELVAKNFRIFLDARERA